METLTLNSQEQNRVMVLNQLVSGAAHGGRSGRATQPVRTTGAALALVHGNRGRKPIQGISEKVRRQVTELATTKYAGCH